MTRTMLKTLLAFALVFAATGCLEFPQDGRYKCASASEKDCVQTGGSLAVTTQSLPDGYLGRTYQATLEATGGSGTLSWAISSGSLPTGLSLAENGVISGTVDPGDAEGETSFVVQVKDGTGDTLTSGLSLQIRQPPSLTTSSLPAGAAGAAYSATLEASGGKAPITFSATGFPEGLSIDPSGAISGTPNADGVFAVTARATDANGVFDERNLVLTIGSVGPIAGGGTSGPPITDEVTIYALDGSRPVSGLGVRLRKNGTEFNPVKEALTDEQGAAHFSGLGFNGTTDTLDVTVSGSGFQNVSMLGVNASAITVPLQRWAEPFPRTGFSSTFDPVNKHVLVTMGKVTSANSGSGCASDIVALNDPKSATWNELSPNGMSASPSPRLGAAVTAMGANLILFGGLDCASQNFFSDELWFYDLKSGAWAKQTTMCPQCPAANGGNGPPARAGASMATDQNGKVWLFGGRGFNSYSNELYVFDQATLTWSPVFSQSNLLPPRADAAMAVIDGAVTVCGGTDAGQQPLQDCWEVTPFGTWSQLPGFPEPILGVKLAVDPIHKTLYALPVPKAGGNRLWSYDSQNGKWLEAIPNAIGPTPDPNGQIFEWDSQLQAFVVTSPRDDGVVWTTDGKSWERHGNPQPQPAPSYQLDVTAFGNDSEYWLTGIDQSTGFYTATELVGTGTITLAGPPEPTSSFVLSGLAVDRKLGTPLALWSAPNPTATRLGVTWTPVPSNEVHETKGSFTTPADFDPVFTFQGSSVERLPGIAQPVHNGGMELDAAAKGFVARHLSADPGATQWAELDAMAFSSDLCEVGLAWEPIPDSGEVSIEATRGVSNLSPGATMCASLPAPVRATEQLYEFTVPAWKATYFAQFNRSVGLFGTDWVVYLPVKSGANAFELPKPSTLTQGRLSPAGQTVNWNVIAWGSGPNENDEAIDYNAMSLRTAWSDRVGIAAGNSYLRLP